MSILIKGMYKPKVCAKCPFWEMRYDSGYYQYEHCKALGKIFNERSMEIDPFEERFNDCPIIEIPIPHGRLIDANKLEAMMYHEAFETDSDMQKWDSGCWIRYKVFENCMNRLLPDTIIETEEK